MSGNLKRQIAGLQRKLAKLDGPSATSNNNGGSNGQTPTQRRRNRRRRAGTFAGAGGAGSTSGQVVAPKVQNPNPKGRTVPLDGSIRIRRRELLASLKLGDSGSKALKVADFPWLKKIAAAYDRVKWHRCILTWRPAVGTTTGGQIIFGPDWDSNSTTTTVEAISCLTPVYESPLWQGGSLTLPPGRLMTRKEYQVRGDTKTADADLSPAYIVYNVGGKDGDAGHLWIEYEVTLFGTV